MAATPAERRQTVNDLMRDGLRHLGDRERIAFFCECGDASCYQAVWLTGSEYDRSRPRSGWTALFPGHASERPTAGAALVARA
jgi:hypothetical protein